MDDELRKEVVTAIEDVFVHTSEVRLHEDVPMLADNLMVLFQAALAKERGEIVQELPKKQYVDDSFIESTYSMSPMMLQQVHKNTGFNQAIDQVRAAIEARGKS